MPRIMTKAITEDFVLDFAFDGDESATITVKQASTGEQVRIASLFSKQTQIWDDAEIGTVKLEREWNPYELQRFRAWLVMVGCDIANENDTPLFRFRKTNNGPSLDMSQSEFNKAWDCLPNTLTEEIHQKVLIVNPQWDFSRLGE